MFAWISRNSASIDCFNFSNLQVSYGIGFFYSDTAVVALPFKKKSFVHHSKTNLWSNWFWYKFPEVQHWLSHRNQRLRLLITRPKSEMNVSSVQLQEVRMDYFAHCYLPSKILFNYQVGNSRVTFFTFEPVILQSNVLSWSLLLYFSFIVKLLFKDIVSLAFSLYISFRLQKESFHTIPLTKWSMISWFRLIYRRFIAASRVILD